MMKILKVNFIHRHNQYQAITPYKDPPLILVVESEYRRTAKQKGRQLMYLRHFMTFQK